jgi:TolB-like protein
MNSNSDFPGRKKEIFMFLQGKKMLFFILSLSVLLICTRAISNAGKEESIVSLRLKELSSQVISLVESSLAEKDRFTIAIIELENVGKRARDSELGKIVSEMLTTNIVQSGNFNVVEREQLSKVLKELKLNQIGLVDANSAKTVGKMLAADSILCGSVSEVGQFFDINVRLIDVEKATIISAAVIEIKQSDFLNNIPMVRDELKIKEKIQASLDLLDTAIYSYSALHSGVQSNFTVVFPKTLKELVPDYLDRIPDPMEGSWVYDSKTGRVYHSSYPTMAPMAVHINKKPFLDAHKKHTVMAGLKNIKIALQIYYQDNFKWPRQLDDLVPYFFAKLPDPVDGKWLYDPDNGEIRHSKYKVGEY